MNINIKNLLLALVLGSSTLAPVALQAKAASSAKQDIGTVAKVYTTAETAPFKKLASDTLSALSAGTKDKMVAKLTDLETAWDDKEKTLKPKDEATWTTLDKTLDKAISALRSSKYNEQKGKAALEKLNSLFDQSTKS